MCLCMRLNRYEWFSRVGYEIHLTGQKELTSRDREGLYIQSPWNGIHMDEYQCIHVTLMLLWGMDNRGTMMLYHMAMLPCKLSVFEKHLQMG